MTVPGAVPQRFADVPDAARALSARLPGDLNGDVDLILALGEPARAIAETVAQRLGTSAAVLPVQRGDAPVIGTPPGCSGCTVVIVDRGVETGQSALAAVAAVREAGAARVILAVPVCPRQAEWTLARAYDDVIAVHRPLGRRSLQWHYASPLE